MSADSIFDWLSTIPDSHCPSKPAPAPSRKRRRLNPATPESSDAHPMSQRGQSPSKRRMVPVDDETPRAARGKRLQTSASGSSYSLSGQSARSSDRSGRLSPRKHLQRLRTRPQGLKFSLLSNFDNRPPSLEHLLDAVDDIMEGRGIVPLSAREALTLAAQSNADFKWVSKADHYFSDSPEIAELAPSLEAVLDVVAAAQECYMYGHPEANWNLEVNQRILELAFRPSGQGKFKHTINFMGSSTAAIIPEYGMPSITKKVDFCIYIDPKEDPSWKAASPGSLQSAIIRLCETLPGEVFNFTDFEPLDQRPVALSIEIKKPLSEGFEGAKLQLGVWQAAHWTFLRHLAAMRSGREQDAESATFPDFIPGIIVQGQEWYLIITTLDGQETTCWQKVAIGSTTDSKGVYQIVRTLQVLRQWAKDIFWPWLRALILDLNSMDAPEEPSTI